MRILVYEDIRIAVAKTGRGEMDAQSIRHVSVRVPWHDRGWDGHVCQDPKGNTACLALNLIAALRDDEAEARFAGTPFDQLDEALRPPCIGERSNFLAPSATSVRVTMPYSTWSKDHEHILPSSVELPGWGGILVPYRWMLRESGWELADQWDLPVDRDREPKGEPFPRFMVDTPWIQDYENQRAMLDGFAGQLAQKQSLVFFYAKQTPLSDAMRSPIVAVGLLEHVGSVAEYPYRGGSPNGRIRTMVWERSFQHSLRRDSNGRFSGGVVLPYQAILALAEQDADINPAAYLAFPPDEAREQFLYGSEHVSHGAAIASLQSIRNAVEKIATLIPGQWEDSIQWIDTQINALWSLRGPAPGLGSALSCIDPNFNGTLFAHALAPQLDEVANPWPVIEQIFDDKRPAPFTVKQPTSMQKKRFALLRNKDPERYRLLQLLSRFELTKAQALFVYDSCRPTAVVANPYLLFEDTRTTETPIGLAIVDQGLYSGGAVKDAWPLPAETKVDIDEADHPLRLRAATVAALAERALSGDSLLSADALGAVAQNLPVSPPVMIDDVALELCEDDFAPAVRIYEIEGRHFAQLEHYEDCGLCIRDAIEARLAAAPAIYETDWRRAIDIKLGAMRAEDSLEEAARSEKAAALAILAGSRLTVLTGAAGSGKTTLLSILLDQPALVGKDLLLLAPTGKARVRLGQQTGRPGQCQTLAQFLLQQDRWDPLTGAHDFSNSGATAPVSTCVIDEASMLTEDQLAALLVSLPKASRIILVGDPRQLPPIGAGRPFVDLISYLEQEHDSRGIADLRIGRRQHGIEEVGLPDVELAELFSGRPLGPGEDAIVGEIAKGNSDRLRFRQWDTAARLREVLAEVMADALEAGDEDLESALDRSLGAVGEPYSYFNIGAGKAAETWQILTAHRDLPHGSADLNRHIKRIGRARRLELARHNKFGWRVIEPRGSDQITYGDKVMCVRNHHRQRWSEAEQARDGYIANGEVGIVIGGASKSHRPKWTKVEFATQPGETFSFSGRDFADHTQPALELAYAVTVHKAQGSEFEDVILVVPANSRLLTRELLYTALTRQKRRLWILHQGAFGALLRLRSDYYSETARRTTNLFRDPMAIVAEPPSGAPVADGPAMLDGRLVHATRRGDLVRSKSEIVIADILHELEVSGAIRYSYEKPLSLGGKERWPDFTIEAGADLWYWEHCGMLDDPSYARRWHAKLDAYAREGITPWSAETPTGRLIITDDGPTRGLDSAALHTMARKLWT